MKLWPPFITDASGLPAIKIGDATLSLESVERGPRATATFMLDIDATEHRDTTVQSGAQGFRSLGEAFSMFLSRMSAAAEAWKFEVRKGNVSDNSSAFPEAVMRFCSDNASYIEALQSELKDENGNASAYPLPQDH